MTRRDGHSFVTSSFSPRNCLFSLTLFVTLAATATVVIKVAAEHALLHKVKQSAVEVRDSTDDTQHL